MMAPGDKLRAIYKDCGYAKLNLFTEPEYLTVPDLGAAFVAVPLYTWLTKHGMEAGVAKKTIRTLLGIVEPVKAAKPGKATKSK